MHILFLLNADTDTDTRHLNPTRMPRPTNLRVVFDQNEAVVRPCGIGDCTWLSESEAAEAHAFVGYTTSHPPLAPPKTEKPNTSTPEEHLSSSLKWHVGI